MIGRTIDDIAPGETAEITRVVERADVAHFADAVGDHNPVHADREFAATTPFREPIAPGIFTAGLISAVIGTRLPGPGAIYLSQSLTFMRPEAFGDSITAKVEVIEVLRERNRVRLATVCANQRGEEVLAGEAWVMPSRSAIVYERASAASPWALAAWQPWTWARQALVFWGSLGVSMLEAVSARRS